MAGSRASSQYRGILRILDGDRPGLGFNSKGFERMAAQIDEEMPKRDQKPQPNFPEINLSLKIFRRARDFFYLNRHK